MGTKPFCAKKKKGKKKNAERKWSIEAEKKAVLITGKGYGLF